MAITCKPCTIELPCRDDSERAGCPLSKSLRTALNGLQDQKLLRLNDV